MTGGIETREMKERMARMAKPVRTDGGKQKRRSSSKQRIGEVLLEMGLLTDEVLAEAIEARKNSGKRLGQTLVDMKHISEEEMAFALAIQLRIPYADLSTNPIDKSVLESIPESICRRHVCAAISIKNKTMDVAMADPLDLNAITDLQFLTGHAVRPSVSTSSQIIDLLDRHYAEEEAPIEAVEETTIGEILEFIPEGNVQEEEEPEVDLAAVSDSPLVRMVDLVINNAVTSGTSDIHIEAHADEVRIRNRVDGVLQEFTKLPKWMHALIISRIKVLGGMDISKRTIPQDGRMKARSESYTVDLRVSTLPTYNGEKAVIRILNKQKASLSIGALGFSDENAHILQNLIRQPQGMVLITGPTGSGKTSTLYACMNEIQSDEINIITVEDPVEFEMKGINQVQIREKVGLTFPFVLRAILRQDPNVIVLGEIRDSETAEIALQASLTGHLVLSTLHTNDAPSSITRLLDIGIPPYLIASAVLGVVAQRLVRKACTNCKEEYVPDEELLTRMNLDPKNLPFRFYHGTGCSQCNDSGYRGRTAIEEILVMGYKIRELVQSGAPLDILREAAIAAGMSNLGSSGLRCIETGTTTIDEVLKVIQQKEGLMSVCQNCSSDVSVSLKNCPYCGKALIPNCASCGRIVRPDWVVCPYCRHDLNS